MSGKEYISRPKPYSIDNRDTKALSEGIRPRAVSRVQGLCIVVFLAPQHHVGDKGESTGVLPALELLRMLSTHAMKTIHSL